VARYDAKGRDKLAQCRKLNCRMKDLIKSARLFANSSHQRINVGRSPALQSPEVHLKSVAQIVASVSEDPRVIAAAWLHDIVEDTSVTVSEVERRFGSDVAKLVDEVTVVGNPESRNRAARSALSRQHFAGVSAAARTIKLADLIDTCRDLSRNEPELLSAYAAEANELLLVLEGGDAHLLAKLKRDLEKYARSQSPAAPVTSGPRSRPFEVPFAALRVLERAFTAKDIADPFISFESKISPGELLAGMTLAEVEVAGLHESRVPLGFVEASFLRNEPGEVVPRRFSESQMVAPESSFMEVIEVLTRHDWCFVQSLETVVGAISRQDVQKPAVRMWLFGILTVAELEFTERIRAKWPDASWSSLLSPQRIDKARQLLAERERRKEKCELIDCLQLADKIEVLLSDASELGALGVVTPSAARRVGKQFESLRNSLAHAQRFVEQDWPQIVRLARRVHQLAEEP